MKLTIVFWGGLVVGCLVLMCVLIFRDTRARCTNAPLEWAGQIERCRQRGGVATAEPVVLCGRAYLRLSTCRLGP